MRAASQSHEDIRLRRVDGEDAPLMLHIYASTRAEELAQVSWWTDQQKSTFVQHQSNAQHEHYRNVYPQAEYFVVSVDERPVGRLYLVEKDSELRILDLTLLPRERNRGIGTCLLKRLIAESAAKKKALSIHVESFNPSLRLFERLGFRKAQENGIYFLLERPPSGRA